MSVRTLLRGEVYWTSFSSSRGGEIAKRRPAIIVSNDIANRHLNRVQVVPLTSNVQRVLPGEAIVTVRGVPNKALASQIVTATKERLGDRIANLSASDMERVESAIRIQLGLDR